ncbi:MAG: ThuA domain-containing protein, partial [Gammaproteobacteria bacterium]
LHTASICFDDWPGWGEVLGARWRWGQSFHPAPQTVQVHVEDPAHELTAGIADFEVEDEIFHALEATHAIHPLLSARATADSAPQPMLWARRHGEGRVVYDALGHTVASISHPVHQRVLQQAARWLTEHTAGDSR